jgi:hypothetical protein
MDPSWGLVIGSGVALVGWVIVTWAQARLRIWRIREVYRRARRRERNH